MKWATFFSLSCAAAVAGTPSASIGHGLCSWSPVPPVHEFSSAAIVADLIDDPSSNNTSVASRAEGVSDSWNGPHLCKEDFCVWSNPGYSGQGIALVTTEASEIILESLPSSPLDVNHTTSHFSTAVIPGKGIGLKATRLIKRGERIMASRPVMLMNLRVLDDLELEAIYRLFETAVKSLPEATGHSFLRQAGELGGHQLVDIMYTNSFQMMIGDKDGDGAHFGNYPEVSRFNHDCRPNVAFYIDKELTHHTHAIRDIQAGEELSISYLDSFRAREVRQDRARRSWGFECTCSQCSLPSKEADASDMRLYSIYEAENKLADMGVEDVTPQMIERLLGLYREERLEFKMAGVYTLAALNYNMLGDETSARKYALLAVDAGLLEHGPQARDVMAMRDLADDPRGHWTWNAKPLG